MNQTSQSLKSVHVCPWWLAYTFDNPLRRLVHPAEKTLAPYVQPGMRAADMGCGFGHFTMGLARLVGAEGSVLAVDVQRKMLDKTMARLRRAGLEDRVRPRLVTQGEPCFDGPLDFILASNVVHEVPDPAAFFAEAAGCIRPGGKIYVMEPSGHISVDRFQAEMDVAGEAGFEVLEQPKLLRERCAVLVRRDLS